MSENYQMYIGGKWVDAANKATFEDHNPYNGEVFANVPEGTRAVLMKDWFTTRRS